MCKERDNTLNNINGLDEIFAELREQRYAYEESLKRMRDLNNVLKTAEEASLEKGIERGIEIGYEKGKEEQRNQIIASLRSKGFTDAQISDILNP